MTKQPSPAPQRPKPDAPPPPPPKKDPLAGRTLKTALAGLAWRLNRLENRVRFLEQVSGYQCAECKQNLADCQCSGYDLPRHKS